MTLRTLYQSVGFLTRPVRYRSKTGLGTPRREAPSAPLKGLAAVAIYGVQMLNAELELAARTG